jgi:hypothetical protein
MSAQLQRGLIGIGGAAAIVVALGVLEANVTATFQTWGQTADAVLVTWAWGLWQVIEMAGLVAIVLLGLAYRTLAVGAAYIVAGAYLAFRMAISIRASGPDWLIAPPGGQALDFAGGVLVVMGFVILGLAVREYRAGGPAPTM